MSRTRYTISEIANILGVTPHMLRHYEKMGIIAPEVNPETGYRYYSVIDRSRFNLSRILLNCGLSLEQCARVMAGMDVADMQALFDDAISEQRLQIERSRVAIRFLQNIREMYARLPGRVDQVWVENLPKMWLLNVSQNERAPVSPSLAEQRRRWLDRMPGVYWTSRIPNQVLRQFSSGRIEYEYGLMCYEADALAMGLQKTEDVEVVAGGDYLVTVHEKATHDPFTWENIAALTGYLQAHQITVFGDAFAHILASRMVDGKPVNYHRVFLKIYS